MVPLVASIGSLKRTDILEADENDVCTISGDVKSCAGNPPPYIVAVNVFRNRYSVPSEFLYKVREDVLVL